MPVSAPAVGVQCGRRVVGFDLEDQIVVLIEGDDAGVIYKDGKAPIVFPPSVRGQLLSIP